MTRRIVLALAIVVLGHVWGIASVRAVEKGKVSEPAGSKGLLQVFQGHEDGVLACSFSPDGTLVASGSADQTVRIWDSQTGKELRKFRGHHGRVTCIAFSGDGRRLASGDTEGSARVWIVGTGELAAKIDSHAPHVHRIALSHDGKRLALGCCNGSAQVWDVEGNRRLSSISYHRGSGDFPEVALSPNGEQLLTGSGADVSYRYGKPWPAGKNCQICLLDASSGNELLRIPCTHAPGWVGFDKDAGRIAATGYGPTMDDHHFQIFDSHTGKQLDSVAYGGSATRVSATPDLGRIVVEAGASIICIDIPQRKVVTKFFGGKPNVQGVAISADGKFALACCGGTGDPFGNDNVERWMPSPESVVRLFDLSVKTATSVALDIPDNNQSQDVLVSAASRDGRKIAVGSLDKKVRLFDSASGGLLQEWSFVQGNAISMAFSPDGSILAAINMNGLHLWDTGTGKPLSNPVHDHNVAGIAFSPDGDLLYLGFNKPADNENFAVGARSFDLKTGKIVRTYTRRQDQEAVCLAISDDGRYLITASLGGPGKRKSIVDHSVLAVWDTSTGNFVRELEPNGAPPRPRDPLGGLAFVNEKVVAVALGNFIDIMDVESGKEISHLVRFRSAVTAVAVSANRKELATIARRGEAYVWDAATWDVTRETSYPNSSGFNLPMTVFFLPDGLPAVVTKAKSHNWIYPLDK